MKPQNLLVFSDMRVKLGDFGASIKFKNNVDQYLLRAITYDYSDPKICEKYDSREMVTKDELLKNDYYCLWKTFDKILNLFKEKISKESIFYQMV